MSQVADQELLIDNQLCFALYSATNAIIRAYRPLLEKLELTYPQYLVMLALWEQDSVSLKSLYEKTGLDSGTLTPLLKRLEAKELLERLRSQEDERLRVIKLTKKGKSLKRDAMNIPKQMLCKVGIEKEDEEKLKDYCKGITKQLRNEQRRS